MQREIADYLRVSDPPAKVRAEWVEDIKSISAEINRRKKAQQTPSATRGRQQPDRPVPPPDDEYDYDPSRGVVPRKK